LDESEDIQKADLQDVIDKTALLSLNPSLDGTYNGLAILPQHGDSPIAVFNSGDEQGDLEMFSTWSTQYAGPELWVGIHPEVRPYVEEYIERNNSFE
jgi:hypothetical protein